MLAEYFGLNGLNCLQFRESSFSTGFWKAYCTDVQKLKEMENHNFIKYRTQTLPLKQFMIWSRFKREKCVSLYINNANTTKKQQKIQGFFLFVFKKK